MIIFRDFNNFNFKKNLKPYKNHQHLTFMYLLCININTIKMIN